MGQLGPAEIPPKRDATYRHVQWLAHRAGRPLRLPAGHPFVSLPLLRLALAFGPTRAVVARLFEFVWVEGHIPQQDGPWAELCAEFGVDPAADFAAVKDALRANTEQAIARGVYGVPTAVVDGERFFEGRPIRVRFVWSGITATHAHWEQAFSDDGGRSWETNWTMDFERAP